MKRCIQQDKPKVRLKNQLHSFVSLKMNLEMRKGEKLGKAELNLKITLKTQKKLTAAYLITTDWS